MGASMRTIQSIISRMREDRVQDAYGVFEINLLESKVTWANDHAVLRSGYTLDQVTNMTLFDVLSDVFHAQMHEIISEISSSSNSGERVVMSIWPLKTPNNKIVWWAVTKMTVEYPLVWIHGDHIQTTGVVGMPFMFMLAFMRATNSQSGILGHVSELKEWTTAQIARLDDVDTRLKTGLSDVESKMEAALKASKEAANAANSTHAMMELLQKSFGDFEAKYGTEILKLIGSDSIHDKRIDAFEKHAKMTTDLAMKSIEMQTKVSSDSIMLQAAESSKGLNRKIVIPVSVIAAVVAIIQVLVERFVK